MENLSIAVCELTSIDNTKENISNIVDCINKIPSTQKLDLITLPENALYMRTQEGAKIEYIKPDSLDLEPLKVISKNKNALIHVGATPVVLDGHNYNATLLIFPDGRVEVPYKKMHLFDIQLEDQKPIRESDAFRHGVFPSVVQYKDWKIGFSICYDIRFTELYLYYQMQEVDLILIPSAFLVETGKAHWQTLNRARAIEAQAYVISAAQGGKHSATKSTYGHSIVTGPWGNIIWENESEIRPLVQVVDIAKNEIRKVRKQIPMKNHRRLSVSFDV